ncbi:MAG: YbjN domain-containing protein [Cellulomonadaceae bacterium]|nr:YbjN domain-containing protein [Cellulomonadaceae bacterium]
MELFGPLRRRKKEESPGGEPRDNARTPAQAEDTQVSDAITPDDLNDADRRMVTSNGSSRDDAVIADDAGLPDDTVLPEDTVLMPLENDRITDWLDEHEFTYFVDNEGDVGGLWHGRIFHFLILGDQDEVLQVRGQWHRDVTIDRLQELLELCNTWNTEHIWPKTYVRVRDDGSVIVCSDVTVDVEHGVTEAQLSLLLQCGLSTCGAFFEYLDTELPDPLRRPA